MIDYTLSTLVTKKKRNAFQNEHSQYTHQELWLGYQTMESIEQDKEAPPHVNHVTSVPIQELLKLGFRENKATELHIAKISFRRLHQQRWPSQHTDGRTRHYFHLTQVFSNIDVNPALVYHILLNFEKPTVAYTS